MVALVCIVFLWHVRSALVAIITLPIAIILSFLPMMWLGLTSNIMSLGGIAIAIGAMVDAAIIMVENAHKALEHFRDEHGRDPDGRERTAVIVAAAKSVGRPLVFSLLVITVSFIPVFSLTGQEGRLFKPLAFTKTFAMFFSALLGITIVPVLMIWLIRGHITPEQKNPVNRLLIWAYQPFVNFVLRFRWFTLITAVLILAATYYPYSKLGKEFMPPLNEGDILYMPTAVPGMSITEATKILQIQDRMLRKVPEVERVFGKHPGARREALRGEPTVYDGRPFAADFKPDQPRLRRRGRALMDENAAPRADLDFDPVALHERSDLDGVALGQRGGVRVGTRRALVHLQARGARRHRRCQA